MWQNAHVNTVRRAMVCDAYFSILRFYDFFKGFAHIYIFLKKLGPLLLYLTYELAQIFMNVNRTDVLLFKQVNK